MSKVEKANKKKIGQNNINLLLKGIGKLFISLRKNKGFKNARLFAELHNIDPGQYNKYERGHSDMQLSSLIKVFNIHGLKEEDIFTPKILNEIKDDQNIDSDVKNAEFKSIERFKDEVRDKVQTIDPKVLTDLQLTRMLMTLIYCLVPKKRKAILRELGLTSNTENYTKNIELLINEKWVAMTIPTKPNSPNQQYYTTEKGKDILKLEQN